MIRDRLVVGLRDAALSEKLQMDSELSLEKSLSMARQREAVKKQQSVVRGETNPNVDRVYIKQHAKSNHRAGKDRHRREHHRDHLVFNSQASALLTKKAVPVVAVCHITTEITALHVMPFATGARTRDTSSLSAGLRISAQF